jgi:hypothetical protein
VAQEFGGAPFARREADPDLVKRLRETGVVRRIYDKTQEALRAQGYGPTDTVTLYRGFKREYGVAGSVESWTIEPIVAEKFDGGGRVWRRDVPVSEVIMFSGGPGWRNGRFGEQHEWVLLGGKRQLPQSTPPEI